MIRPIVFFDQEDVENIQRDHEFLCGNDILVAPVLNHAGQTRNFYLPSGQWYSYWDGTLYEGKNNYTHLYGLNTFPFFVKAGTVLPMYPVQQYVDEKEVKTVDLKIYYSHGTYKSEYYDDAHDGYGYESGDYRLASFESKGDADSLIIQQTIDGTYKGALSQYRLHFIGLPFEITRIMVDGQNVDYQNGEFIVNSDFKKMSLS